MTDELKIRKASLLDFDKVWEIFGNVIQTGDTYVFDPETPIEDLQKHWFAPNMHTYVVENPDRKLLGTYILKPNQIDLGSHVANASYMVHPSAQGQGIGKMMCAHSLAEAKGLGFSAMQFNLVVDTNQAAIRLWQKFEFKIIGTIPKAFKHQSQGLIDAHIMYRKL